MDLGLHVRRDVLDKDEETLENIADLRRNVFWAVCSLDT
jgi:hypothetical protein